MATGRVPLGKKLAVLGGLMVFVVAMLVAISWLDTKHVPTRQGGEAISMPAPGENGSWGTEKASRNGPSPGEAMARMAKLQAALDKGDTALLNKIVGPGTIITTPADSAKSDTTGASAKDPMASMLEQAKKIKTEKSTKSLDDLKSNVSSTGGTRSNDKLDNVFRELNDRRKAEVARDSIRK